MKQEIKFSNIETKGAARKELHDLEKTGEYVFHGSATSDIEKLKPIQAYNFIHKKGRVEDGPPGVAASPFSDIAIFRALVRTGKNGFEADSLKRLFFKASQSALQFAKNTVGYVYVLNRKDFKPKVMSNLRSSPMDWRSEKEVRPVKIIEIHYDDLPKENIDIIEE